MTDTIKIHSYDALDNKSFLQIISDPTCDKIKFVDCTFVDEIKMNKLSVKKLLVFWACTFSRGASFEGAEFGYTYEDSDQFKSLERPKFRGKWFKETVPLDRLWWRRKPFRESFAIWEQNESQSTLSIDKCTFEGNLSFRGAVFRDTVWISNSRFAEDVSFTNSIFEKTFRFMNNSVDGNFFCACTEDDPQMRISRANFRQTVFCINNSADEPKRMLLNNRDLRGAIDFRQCSFRTMPEFYGVKISGEFDISFSGFAPYFGATTARDARNLRLLLSDNHGISHRAPIIVHELRAERRSGMLGPGIRTVSALYDLISLYGYSTRRPFTWSIVLYFIFVSVINILTSEIGLFDFSKYLSFGSTYFYPPFAANPRYFVPWVCGEVMEGCTNPMIIGSLGSAYGVAQIILFWLLGLAVLRRFNLK